MDVNQFLPQPRTPHSKCHPCSKYDRSLLRSELFQSNLPAFLGKLARATPTRGTTIPTPTALDAVSRADRSSGRDL